jgi:hypothetical protein
MTLRKLCSLFLTALAALLSLVVMGHGLVSAVFIDTRFNPVLSILYCVLPILSFPVFVLARLFRKLVVLQVILLLAWIPVYSALNWRTCASLGYCTTVAATVILTLKTPVVLAFIGVNLFGGAALLLGKIWQTSSNA